MDLFDQMRTFVRVVDSGRIGAAAKSRGMSVAAVSRQLAALERELGTTLIVRSTRQLAVTDHGRRWYRYCADTLQELEKAKADVADSAEPQGTVVVSAPVSYALSLLVERMESVTRKYPQLNVELRLEDQAVDLLATGVDIAVRIGVTLPDSSSVHAHRLVTFRRALVTSTAYLRRHGTPKHPRDLERHELLEHTRASQSFTRWQFVKGEETVEIVPKARLRSTSPVVLREWAKRGAGIALIPAWFADDCKVVLADWQTPEITASAIFRAEARGAARVRVVLEALAEGMAAYGDINPTTRGHSPAGPRASSILRSRP